MSFEIWIVYVTTVLIMMSTPGPSQLLMLTNSATNGFSRSLFTLFGDLTANVCQMLAAGLGLAAFACVRTRVDSDQMGRRRLSALVGL